VGVGTVEYKFTLDGWEGQELFEEGTPCTSTVDGFTNRSLDVSEEVTLAPVCWEECAECGANDIAELTLLDLTITPNPSTGLVNLTIADELQFANGQVSILTLDGKRLISTTARSLQNGRLDLSALSNGMYIIDIRSDKYQSSQRLLIQK